MKKYLFKAVTSLFPISLFPTRTMCLLFVTLSFSQSGQAQTPEFFASDSALTTFEISDTIKPTSVKEFNTYYERRLHSFNNRWKRLMPRYTKLQFAGGMGLLSMGMGWDYGKHQQWETDLFLGYLPKYSTKEGKLTMTIKQNYLPWKVHLNENWQFTPLSCGLYLNSILADEFWVDEPNRYPKGYYGFSSKIRIHIFAGQRFTYRFKDEHRKRWRDISFFYEFETCDLYIVSAFTNNYLSLTDIISLSLGIKFQFF